LKVLEYDLLVLEKFDLLEVYQTFRHVTMKSGNFVVFSLDYLAYLK